MASFNLENNIREKLENRELNPSPEAWKKLESQLNEKQPKKKSVGWYYMAASVVAVLIVTSIFINSNSSGIENKLVKENVQQEDGIETRTEIVSISPNSSAEENASEESKTEKDPKRTSKNVKPVPSQKESAVDKKIKKSEMLADGPDKENQKDSEITPLHPLLAQDDIFNAKVNEVVASVKSLQEKNEKVTVAEVEALLNNARRDIQTQRILSSPKVDATALLQDVEWELEKSFRDKVFNALGEGFNKIRTAFSGRND